MEIQIFKKVELSRKGLIFPNVKIKEAMLFIPTWLILILSFAVIAAGLMSAIRIEQDEKITFEIVTTSQEQPSQEQPRAETVKLYEFIIGGDTLLMNEDPSNLFAKRINEAAAAEEESVNDIIKELKTKFNITKSRQFILAEVRPTTRKKLFYEVPEDSINKYFPLIEIETEKVKITKPNFTPEPVQGLTPPKVETEAAPLTFGAYNEAEARAYISKYKEIAKAQEKKYGIPAAITLAQGLHESNAGKSRLATAANNHFGIKCFEKTCKKGHCKNFTDDSHKDFFRTFSSVAASFEYHSIFLQKTRYKHLLKLPKSDYKNWCKGLQNAGYATDKNYANKLIKTIQKYKLNEL